MTAVSPPAQPPSRRMPRFALVVAVAIGGLVGAYVDWTFWAVVYGQAILITVAAVAVLIVAGAHVLLAGSHRTSRFIAPLAVALAVGVLVGQIAGPSREPLLYSTGTMTLHLTSPTVATATGPAMCQNVASATDYMIESDYTAAPRVDIAGDAFVMILISRGERWNIIWPGSRKDDLLLRIRFNPAAVADDGSPTETEMEAGPSSTLISSFTNEGGSIEFSNLQPRVAAGLTGEPMQLAGTLEWTCDSPL